MTFDLVFLLGTGPFWANPLGPFLQEEPDIGVSKNGDVLNVQIAHQAFLHAG